MPQLDYDQSQKSLGNRLAQKQLGLKMTDALQSRINNLLGAYALSKKPDMSNEEVEKAVEKTKVITHIAKSACIDILQGELDLLLWRDSTGTKIPPVFIAGLMHAIDVLEANDSIVNYQSVTE